MSQLIVCGARLWTHVTYGVDQACPKVAVQRVFNGQGAGVAFTPDQKSRGKALAPSTLCLLRPHIDGRPHTCSGLRSGGGEVRPCRCKRIGRGRSRAKEAVSFLSLYTQKVQRSPQALMAQEQALLARLLPGT